MKQSVVFFIVLAVIVGAAVAGFTVWRKSQAPPSEMGGSIDLDLAAARAALTSAAGIALPDNASDVRACHQTQIGRWIAVRFDMPAADTAAWLADKAQIAKVVEGKATAELHSELETCSSWVNRPWWDVSDIAPAAAGQAEGTAKTASGQSKWRLRICTTSLPDNKTRVYLLFMDDAAPATQPAK
jgi:uncharacterized membrane protein